MRLAKNAISLVLLAAFLTSAYAADEITPDASKLIKEARNYDGLYAAVSQADQQKALAIYQEALTKNPDSEQKLHILYRMAQLNGSIYNPQNGENPDYHKAIGLYKQIVEDYPASEPQVYNSMLAISGHYTTLRNFDAAVEWVKKALDYDTSGMEQQLKSLEKEVENLPDFHSKTSGIKYSKEEIREFAKKKQLRYSLKRDLDEIKKNQLTAVDQLAYSADRIGFLRTHGELRALLRERDGSSIGERASELLKENMDKMPQLWAPPKDGPVPFGLGSQADTSAPAANSKKQSEMQILQSEVTIDEAEKQYTLEPNGAEIDLNDKHLPKEPRASPSKNFREKITLAAELAALGLVVVLIIIKRKPLI